MNLKTAHVIGFFSLPSSSLAETNPDAFRMAWAAAPAGAGSCAHCGTGILHHVAVKTDDGQTAFIGTLCAQKIGGEVAKAASAHLTTEQLVARTAKFAMLREDVRKHAEVHTAKVAARCEFFANEIADLEASGNSFYSSLASQIKTGSLSWKQTNYALKALFGRRNKANAARYDAMQNALQTDLGNENYNTASRSRL